MIGQAAAEGHARPTGSAGNAAEDFRLARDCVGGTIETQAGGLLCRTVTGIAVFLEYRLDIAGVVRRLLSGKSREECEVEKCLTHRSGHSIKIEFRR